MTTLTGRIAMERPAGATHSRGIVTEQLFDPWVIFVVGALMTIGVVMVYSASVTLAGASFSLEALWDSPLKQSIFALVGFFAMLFAAHLDYRIFAMTRSSKAWVIGAILLFAVSLTCMGLLIPDANTTRLASQRALTIRAGGFSISFQPAEFAKLALVICVSAVLTRPGALGGGRAPGSPGALQFWQGFAPAVAIGGILVGLTGIADFGTAALMGVVFFSLLIVGRARWSQLGLVILAGCAAAAVLVIIEPYRVKRLLTFAGKESDPLGSAYQVTQSLIAIGSGGWWGRGLGAGVQKYGYLPQDNNDFIMAIICEELGFVGGAVVVFLFLAMLMRGWLISSRAGDEFGRLMAIGVTLTICVQAAFNIGVVTQSLPTKGISLPFVSAGGSGV
ncbi:MAG: FtsW/RodA/SpoVE family cell cycle protein, partial [Phycisphaerales bacterium]|nr:FtsW/RodA/SpoVE family cell cycle protein [Phycisphaerales bacterium]